MERFVFVPHLWNFVTPNNRYPGGELMPLAEYELMLDIYPDAKPFDVWRDDMGEIPGLVTIQEAFEVDNIIYLRGDIMDEERYCSLRGYNPHSTPTPTWDKQDTFALKKLGELIGLTDEQKDQMVKEWSGGHLISRRQITQENIKAIIVFLKKRAIMELGEEAVQKALQGSKN